MTGAALRRLAFAAAAFLLTPGAAAETVYISDELSVPLRSGPGNQYRILHRGLPSGTRLEVLGEDAQAGFTRVRLADGTEGWLRSQYLVDQPIARMRLAAAQREAEQVRRQLAEEREKVAELSAATRRQADAGDASGRRIAALEAELEEIKRLSAKALELNDENLALAETNLRLRDEIDDLAEERNRLLDNDENQAIMIGAGLVLLGLILGVIIKARPQRSAWS